MEAQNLNQWTARSHKSSTEMLGSPGMRGVVLEREPGPPLYKELEGGPGDQ